MKSTLFLIILCALVFKSHCQELYVFTEPASNMPSKSVALRLTGRFPNTSVFKHRYVPEAMIGISKNWMVHLSGTVSDYYSSNLQFESGRIYGKYRFISNDDVHRHFRMAAFGEMAYSKAPYLYDDANLDGDNSGFQIGLIATQLVNKLAVSSTVSYARLVGVNAEKLLNTIPSYNVVNYTFSAGYLILPKAYKNYKQTNVNAYIELLGAKSIDQNKYAIDLAPAVQCIFNSNSKVNIGYRFQLSGNMDRIAKSTFQIAFEHTLFNLWK